MMCAPVLLLYVVDVYVSTVKNNKLINCLQETCLTFSPFLRSHVFHINMNTLNQRLSIKKLTLNEMLETQSGENIVGSTTREKQGQRYKLHRTTVKTPFAFAVGGKPAAATVVDSISRAMQL